MRHFDLDRAVVVGLLFSLSRSLSAGATEMATLAAERVFDKYFSMRLCRKAQALQRSARQLNSMREEAARLRSS